MMVETVDVYFLSCYDSPNKGNAYNSDLPVAAFVASLLSFQLDLLQVICARRSIFAPRLGYSALYCLVIVIFTEQNL
jgi:hypothetical protein